MYLYYIVNKTISQNEAILQGFIFSERTVSDHW